MILDKINKTPTTKWIVVGCLAAASWAIGYFLRWDQNTKRPYIDRHDGAEIVVNDIDDSDYKSDLAEGLTDEN